jgi:hypothetical protein
MAPTAGHHGYAPALPHQQNAFGVLANYADSDDDSVETVATQVAALTYQSQLTASTAANSSHCQEIQLAHLASQQNMMHKNMHQLIEGLNAVAFNISNKGCRVGCFAGQSPYGSGYVPVDVPAQAQKVEVFPLQACMADSHLPAVTREAVSQDLCPKLHLKFHLLVHPNVSARNLIMHPGGQGCPHVVWDMPPSRHPNPSNNHSPTRLNATPTGTCATPVGLMRPMATQVCHAQPIFMRLCMTSTSRTRMRNNTSILAIPVPPGINTRCSSQTCEG